MPVWLPGWPHRPLPGPPPCPGRQVGRSANSILDVTQILRQCRCESTDVCCFTRSRDDQAPKSRCLSLRLAPIAGSVHFLLPLAVDAGQALSCREVRIGSHCAIKRVGECPYVSVFVGLERFRIRPPSSEVLGSFGGGSKRAPVVLGVLVFSLLITCRERAPYLLLTALLAVCFAK